MNISPKKKTLRNIKHSAVYLVRAASSVLKLIEIRIALRCKENPRHTFARQNI